MLELNHGELDGRRLFSEAQSREMWTSQTILPIEPPASPALAPVQPNFRTYGLGWHLDDYRGRKMVWHSGELAGYYSRVTMLPDMKLGAIVFTNQEEDGVYHALSYTILDHYLGAASTDWVAVFHELRQKQGGRRRTGDGRIGREAECGLASIAGGRRVRGTLPRRVVW
jgi:hypothetical protein